MEFRILGGLEVSAGGRHLQLGDARDRRVLAVLLLDAGQLVSMSRLVDAVWDDPPGTAAKQIRNAVSRLRRQLGRGAAPSMRDCLVTESTGYRMVLGDDTLDARIFEGRVAQAQQLAVAGQVTDAASLLRTALDLWQGPFLAGMSGRIFEGAAAAWTERRYAAAEAYYNHQLELGRHRQVVAELSALVADDPLREWPVAQLMLALYRCGRKAGSLALYRDTRVLLADQLGVDPDPALQRLHQQILADDPDLRDGELYSPPGRRPQQIVPRQLPCPVRHFTGRAEEMAVLTGLLDQAAGPGATVVISAIGGTAGIGKTALAVHWAHQAADQFPDGQLYVNMRGYDPSGQPLLPAEAIRGFLDALQVPPRQIPGGLDAQAGLYRSLLAGKRLLIVIDNARDAGQVTPLLPGCPGCMVVVTSRSQLTGLVAGHGAYPLTLSLPSENEARRLLTRLLGTDRTTGEPQAVSRLVSLCSRLPLALSIVAARAVSRPQLALSVLSAELLDERGRLDALHGGDAAASVRSVFSWSYQQLSAPAASMFRLIGLHPGPDISAPAAASLAGISLAEANHALAELTRAHVMTEHRPYRYAFHDLLRTYAAERARSDDSEQERSAATHRVLDHYLHTAYAAALLMQPTRDAIALATPLPRVTPEQLADCGQALAWCDAEHRVLLAAVAQAAAAGLGAHAWQLPWSLVTFFYRREHWRDWAETERAALAAARRVRDYQGQAHAHHHLGYPLSRIGCYAEAHAHLRQALSLHRKAGDRIGHADTLLTIARVYERQGRYADALGNSVQALTEYRAAGYRAGQADAFNAAGWCHAQLGEGQQAMACCHEALGLHLASGHRYGEAATWDSVGYIHHQRGEHAEAAVCYQRALNLYQQLSDRFYQTDALNHLGDTQAVGGNPSAARGAWQQALSILEDLQHPSAAGIRAKLNALSAVAD